MVYAVKYVNENKLLPQQITLGYDIRDTCGKVITALKESLDFVNERKKVSSERESNSTTNLSTLTSLRNPIAVLGAGNSVISSAVNDILSIFRVPQVGYASTSRLLSNKNRYPTFLRTVPSDSHQGKAMARIVSNLGWNYVAMFASDDVYGRPLAETFKTEAKKLGICLALDILIPSHPPNGTIRKLVSKLRQNKNLNIILLFASEDEAVDFLQEAMLQNVAKKLWIASDSWADSPKIAEDNAEVVDGMLRIINQPIVVPDFMKDFYNLNPFNNPQNFWFSQFWEEIFQCSILKHNMTLLKENRFSLRAQCKGKEKLADKFLQTDAVFSRVSYVLDAVLSIVFSVRKICQSTLDTQTSSEVPRKNACINNITPSSVLSKIFNVTFTSVTNRTVLFNKNGDGMGRYDIINFQKRAEGGLNSTSLKIGEYDGETGFLKLARNSIHLPGGVTSPSFGLCSLECPPGTFKVVSKLICCWTCWTCPSGSISNTAGASSCTQCLSNKTPNESKSKCVSLPIRFLRWDSSWAWIVNVTILLCELTCLITVVIFLHNKETPIVKAANREISFLLLFGLMSGFLIPLLYIAFKSRKLPQNYNEAKFISFAMFVFNFVWLTFVSTFYGTPEGEHNVIINSFAILASNLAILTLIYGPKLYIILLRPDLNQMSVFRAITSQYTFRPSRRSSAITSDMMGNSCILKENKYVQTTVEIKEEICHEQICNEPVRVAIGFNSHDKEISKTVEVEEEGTESKERKDLEHRTWGHIRVLNMRAKSDTALSRSFDNPHALAFGKTEGKRACVEHTTDDANMLIHQEIVNQREKSSHRKYTSLNELQYPLKAEAAKESMHHLYRQEKERCAFSSKKQLESEV
ncbi:Metabotropic glutamate receptor 4 [Stylophora pistillata]|uniref:Metabotropic glutamate receptor 4 n=1 Tax=Stylophora pistillata TaxID=50429 RepID=A0A2B4RRE3_STYPI|nr:Metabotropic glutamate receptor 4 [Stylophora pistillata]